MTHISLEKYSSLLTPGTSHSYLVFHISDSEEYVIRGGWNGSALDSDVVIEAGVPMNVSKDNLGLTISERYAGVSSDGKTPAGMRLHITDMDPDSIWLLMTNFVNKLDSALEANGNGYTAWDTNCNFVTAHVLYSVGIDPNSIQDDNGDRFIGWTNLEGWTPPDIPLYAFDYQMSGTSSSDRMFGNGGIQTFDGGGGDDTFYGGGGSDTIYGRSGNDRFYISMGQDTIEGGAGHDTINVRNPEYFYDEHLTFDDSTINQFVEIIGSLRSDGTIAIAVSEAKSEKSAVASSIEAIVASDGCDFIYVDHAWHGHVSDPGVIAVNGAGGSDVIKGSSGRDWLIGGSGSDRLYGDDVGEVYKPFAPLSGEGNWLSGGVGDDWIFGSAGGDDISGGANNDVIRGNAGGDNINGGDNRDFIEGGWHDDVILGGGGNDIVFGFEASTSPIAYPLSDLYAQMDADSDTVINNFLPSYLYDAAPLTSQPSDLSGDMLRGEGGNDVLIGGIGNDTIKGGADNDFLVGGSGDDILVGGSGADTFVFSKVLSLDEQNRMDENGDIVARSSPAVAEITDFESGMDSIYLPGPATDAKIWNLPHTYSVARSFEADQGLFAGSASLVDTMPNLRYAHDGDTIFQRFDLTLTWLDWDPVTEAQEQVYSDPLTVDVAGLDVAGGFAASDLIGAPVEDATLAGQEPDWLLA